MQRMRRGSWALSRAVLLNHELQLFSESYYCPVIPWKDIREKKLELYLGPGNNGVAVNCEKK
jgi:hypothetical protein